MEVIVTTWKTAVAVNFHQLYPLKPAIQLPKKIVHYAFQVVSKLGYFTYLGDENNLLILGL